MKKSPPYKPFVPIIAVAPDPDPPAPPPPPPVAPPVIPAPVVVVPPPAPEPRGTRLDFMDPATGVIHTKYALYRPLGIKHHDTAPIKAHDFTLNSYAKEPEKGDGEGGLGVQNDWELVKVGGVDVKGKTDFVAVAEMIENELRKWDVWPLRISFNEKFDGTGESKVVSFTEKPIGIQFSNRAPVRVDKVYPESPAAKHNLPI